MDQAKVEKTPSIEGPESVTSYCNPMDPRIPENRDRIDAEYMTPPVDKKKQALELRAGIDRELQKLEPQTPVHATELARIVAAFKAENAWKTGRFPEAGPYIQSSLPALRLNVLKSTTCGVLPFPAAIVSERPEQSTRPYTQDDPIGSEPISPIIQPSTVPTSSTLATRDDTKRVQLQPQSRKKAPTPTKSAKTSTERGRISANPPRNPTAERTSSKSQARRSNPKRKDLPHQAPAGLTPTAAHVRHSDDDTENARPSAKRSFFEALMDDVYGEYGWAPYKKPKRS